MKTISTILIIALLAVIGGCSSDPDAPPRFRVKNDRSTDASLKVQTSGGNTININNVAPGTTSAYQDVAPGQVDVTVTIQGEQGDFTASWVASTNQSYTIVVANTTPPTVGIVIP
ncbi:MAG: hypothetical protein MUF82_06140 [Bacteroidetes bacterium]|jgi:hypothetical protein|nr:hypothetical protein [Bacteroidota bacterium]